MAVWPGRKALAAVDALAWPLALVAAVALVPAPTGVVGAVVAALAVIAAARRAWRAVFRNYTYRFTCTAVGAPILTLLAIGMVLKLAS